MSARTNLVINDRKATPVAHTFSPDGSDANGVHVFTEKTGVPASDSRFTAGIRQSNGKYRVTFRLNIPIVQTQTINGVSNPVIVRNSIVEVGAVFDALSTEAERADAIGLMANSLASSQVMLNDMIVKLNDIY